MNRLIIFICFITNIKAQNNLFFENNLDFADTTISKNKVKFMRYLSKDSIQNIISIFDLYYDSKGRPTAQVEYNKGNLEDTAYIIKPTYFNNKLIKQKSFIFYPKSYVFTDFCKYDLSQYQTLGEKKILGFANYKYKNDSVYIERYCTCNGVAESYKQNLRYLVNRNNTTNDGIDYYSNKFFFIDDGLNTIIGVDSVKKVLKYIVDSSLVNFKTISFNDVQFWNKKNSIDTITLKTNQKNYLLSIKNSEGSNEYFYKNNKLQTIVNRFSTGELGEVLHVNFESNVKKDGILFDGEGKILYFKLDYSQKGKVIIKFFIIKNENLQLIRVEEYNTNGLILRSSIFEENSNIPIKGTKKSEVIYEYEYY